MEREEVIRYCIAPAGSHREIEEAVDALLARGSVGAHDRYVFLPGRQSTVLTRRRLSLSSETGWCTARRWGRVIWMLPFVRMVAVTGSLAVDGLEADGDIDYMIVAEPNRLWLARAFCLLVWRLAWPFGAHLCPNYLVTTEALAIEQHDLYTARELIQMVPLHGREVAARLWTSNLWSLAFLPNARLEAALASDAQRLPARLLKRLGERILGGRAGDRLEAWERERKIAKLTGQVADTRESMFTDRVCKHHVDAHGSKILELYQRRLSALGQLEDEEPSPAQWPAASNEALVCRKAGGVSATEDRAELHE
jgi:hypothetical protein